MNRLKNYFVTIGFILVTSSLPLYSQEVPNQPFEWTSDVYFLNRMGDAIEIPPAESDNEEQIRYIVSIWPRSIRIGDPIYVKIEVENLSDIAVAIPVSCQKEKIEAKAILNYTTDRVQGGWTQATDKMWPLLNYADLSSIKENDHFLLPPGKKISLIYGTLNVPEYKVAMFHRFVGNCTDYQLSISAQPFDAGEIELFMPLKIFPGSADEVVLFEKWQDDYFEYWKKVANRPDDMPDYNFPINIRGWNFSELHFRDTFHSIPPDGLLRKTIKDWDEIKNIISDGTLKDSIYTKLLLLDYLQKDTDADMASLESLAIWIDSLPHIQKEFTIFYVKNTLLKLNGLVSKTRPDMCEYFQSKEKRFIMTSDDLTN
jgi:hypothetical protein